MIKPTPKRRVLYVRRFTPVFLAVFGVFSLLVINVRAPKIVYATAASTVNFQARLQTASGGIVPDGTYNVEFKLYKTLTSTGSSQGSCTGDSNCLWTEDYTNTSGPGSSNVRIQVADGYLSAALGSINPFPTTIDWSQQMYLTMNIGGTGTTATWDGEMSPRLALTASTYAFQAGSAAQANQLYNLNSGNTSTLTFQGSASGHGNQSFIIQDQGAAGTYNLLTTTQANSSYVELQTGTPSQQIGQLDINGAATVGSIVTTSLDTASAGAISIGSAQANAIALGNTTSNIATTINGTTIVKPTSGHDSTTAFQLQNASGTSFFTANSVNGSINTQDLNVGSATNISTAGRLFSDGFESGNLSLWNAGLSQLSTSTITVGTGTVREGKYAANVNLTVGGSAMVNTSIGSTTTIDERAYVYITSQGSNPMNLMGMYTTANANKFFLYRDTSGNLDFWNGAIGAGTVSSTVMSTGGWHQIELDVTINSSTGSATVYLDGTAVVTSTNINTGSSPMTDVNMGDSTGGRVGVFSVDDLSVDTVRPGNSADLNVADSLHVSGTSSFGGGVLIQSAANSTSALQAVNSSSASIFNVDTTNSRVSVDAGYATMGTPTGLSVGTATSGGSLTDGNIYYYKVTAIDGLGGETAASTEASSLTIAGTNQTLPITWTAATGASGYKVYRATTSGSEVYLTTVLTNSFTDSGSITPGSATPPSSTTAYTSTNSSSASGQLTIGGNGTPTSQLYVSGEVPSNATGSVLTGSNPTEVSVQGNYAYVVNHGASTLQIFDVSNPAVPVLMSSVNTGSGPQDIVVQGTYAYVSNLNNSGSTIQVFNVSNPHSPTSVATVQDGFQLAPYGLSVQGNYLYVITNVGATLQTFNISNPAAPTLTGSVSAGSGPRSVYVQGRYAYVTNRSGNTLQIFNVSNPASLSSVGTVTTGTAPQDVVVQGRYAYVTNTTSSTLQIIDVNNPASPVSVSTVSTGGGSGGPDDVYIQGRYAYVTNNTAGTLQVIDISNPASPFSVGSVSTGSGPFGLFVNGGYAYVVNNTAGTLQTFNLGGEYAQQLQTGGIQTGTLQVAGDSAISGSLALQGGLTAGGNVQFSNGLGVTGNTMLQGTLSIAGGIQGGATISGISTPGAPTITFNGTTGTTAIWTYNIAAVSASGGITPISSGGSISSSDNTTLSGTSSNIVVWSPVAGAIGYKVYRTAVGISPSTTGLITTTGNGFTGNMTSATTLNDTGLAGDGSTASTFDTSGQVIVNGAATFADDTNSTSAFQVQSSSSASILDVDTSNSRVGILTSTPTNYTLSFGSGSARSIGVDDNGSSAGNSLTINAGATTVASNVGGDLNLNAGTGNTTGSGGSAALQGGTGGATGNGGSVTVKGGTGGSTSGAGGTATLQGGSARGAFAGGAVTVQGGAAFAAAGSNGGAVAINGAAGSTNSTGGAGGNVTITGGNAGGSGNNAGGSITLQAGTATGSGASGGITLNGAVVMPATAGYNLTVNENSTFGTQAGTTLTVGSNNVPNAKLNVNTGSTVALRAYQAGTNDIGQFAETGAGVGTVTTNNTTTLAGSSTQFTQYFQVGDAIMVGGQLRTVASITNDSSLTVNSAFTTSTGGQAYSRGVLGAGNLSSTSGSASIVGSGGTTFLTTFQVGDSIMFNGESTVDTVASIANDTHLTLFANAGSTDTTVAYARYGYDRLDIKANGNVGIGTNSPTAALTIQPNGVGQAGFLLQAANGQTASLMNVADSSSNSLLGITTSGTDAVSIGYTGSSSVNSTVNIGNATNGVQTVTVGSTSSTSTTTVQGGAGGTTINDTGGSLTLSTTTSGAVSVNSAGVLSLSSSGANNISLTTNSASAGVVAESATNSTTAFQIQNSNGASGVLFNADTTNMRISIGSSGSATGQLYISGSVASGVYGTSPTLTGSASPWGIKVVGNYAYVPLPAANKLQIMDVSNPASPIALTGGNSGVDSTLATTGPTFVSVQGHYAYVSESGGKLEIIDVSNPASPVGVGSVSTGTSPQGLYVQGRYAYIVNKTSKTLQVFDVSNPTSPTVVSTTTLGGGTLTNPQSIVVQGRYAYVTFNGTSGLESIDISNPASPSIVQTLTDATVLPLAYGLYVQGRFAYVASNGSSAGQSGLGIVDIKSPTSMAVVTGSFLNAGTNAATTDVVAQGNYAYITNRNNNTIQTVNVANPASPASLGTLSLGGSSAPSALSIQGRYAYIADSGTTTFQAVDLGGEYAQQLQAGGIETGTLQIDSSANVVGDINIGSGLTVGGDSQLNGDLGINGAVNVASSNSITNSLPVTLQQSGTGNTGIQYTTTVGSFYQGEDTTGTFNISSSTSIATGRTTIMGQDCNAADTINCDTTTETGTNGLIMADQYTATATGSISSINVYINTVGTGSPTVEAGIYSDSANAPNSLLNHGSSTTAITSTGWLNIPIPTTAVTSGAKYWFTFEFSSATTGFGYNTLTPSAWYGSGTATQGTWNAAWTSYTGHTTAQGNNSLMWAAISGTSSSDSLGNSLFNLSQTGQATFQDSADSTTAFQIQNAAGTSLLAVDTVANDVSSVITVGTTTSGNSQQGLQVNSYSGTALEGSSTSGTGVIGTSGSNNGVYGYSGTSNGVSGASNSGTSGYFQSASATNTNTTLLTQQNGSATGSLFKAMTSGGGTLFNITSSGAVNLQNSANSTAALQVQNAGGANTLLNVDTANINLSSGATFNTATAAREWSVLESTNIATPNSTSYTWTNGVSPRAIGNIQVLGVGINSTTFSVSSITGGGVTTWHQIQSHNLTGSNHVELWYGVVTSTGTSSVTLNYSGTVNVSQELINQEYTAGLGAGTNWAVTTSSSASNTASFNMTFPSLTSGSVAGGLYVGYGAEVSGNASAGSNANANTGFTFEASPVDNDMYAYNTSLAAGTAYQPVAAISASSTSNVTAAILTASTDNTFSVNGATEVAGGASQTAFQVQNATGGALFNVDSANNIISLDGAYSGTIGGWQPSSNVMPNIMANGAAVAANGYIFDVSGNENGSTTSSHVYSAKANSDGTVGSWTALSEPSTVASTSAPVRFQGSVAVNGYLYMLGGNDGTNDVKYVQYAQIMPNGTLGTWKTTTTLPTTVAHETAVTANGYIYVIGGETNTTPTLSSVVYYGKVNADGTISSWSTGGALTSALRQQTAVYANGNIIVMGGGDGTNASTIVQTSSVNASTGANAAFSTTGDAALPGGRNQATAGVANGYVYVVGGRNTDNTNAPQSPVYYGQLNPNGTVSSWGTSTGSALMPIPVFGQSMVTVNGYLISMGGWNSAGVEVNGVYSATTARVTVNASLDLVGSSYSNLADGGDQSNGSLGGSLTAGNTNVVGTLQVANQASFNQSLSVNGNFTANSAAQISGSLTAAGSATFIDSSNSTTAFQVQNSSGTSLVNVDTTNSAVNLGAGGSLNPFGYTTVGLTGGSGYINTVMDAAKYVATYSGTISSVTVWVDSPDSVGSTHNHFEVAVYQDSGSNTVPNTLLGTSVSTTYATASAWNTASLTTPVSVIVGHTYWLTYADDSTTGANADMVGDSSPTGLVDFSASSTYNTAGMPSSWPGNSGNLPNINKSIYANYSSTGYGLSLGTNGSLSSSGAATFESLTNSTTAFQIQNNAAASIFTADTSNNRIIIGTGSTGESTAKILVLDSGNTTTDPAGVAGAMYYNSAMGMFRCYITSWGPCSMPTDATWGYNIDEEFLGDGFSGTSTQNCTGSGTAYFTSTYSWDCDGSGGAATSYDKAVSTDTYQHPGVVELGTGTSTNWTSINLGGSTASSLAGDFIIGGGETIEMGVKVPTLATSGQNYTLRLGLCDTFSGTGAGGDCGNGAYFKYAQGLNSGNWEYITAAGGTSTVGTSSTAAATGWSDFKIVANTSTSVSFYIKASGATSWTLLGTSTTNIPNTSSNYIAPTFMISKTAGTTSSVIDVDYFQMWNNFTTPR